MKYRIQYDLPVKGSDKIFEHHDFICELEEIEEDVAQGRLYRTKETLEEKFVNNYFLDKREHETWTERCKRFSEIAREHYQQNPEELGLIGKVENMVSKEKVLKILTFDILPMARLTADNIDFVNGYNKCYWNIRQAIENLKEPK